MKIKKRLKYKEEEKGITLISLVITIIIIIILSTVTINLLLGDNGLISQSRESKNSMESTISQEEIIMDFVSKEYGNMMKGEPDIAEPIESDEPMTVIDAKPNPGEEMYIYKNTTQIKDATGVSMWIPGGFGIAEDSATNINKGVVITDGTNEFVWIPVNDSKLSEMYSTTTPVSASNTALSKSSLGESTTNTKIYSKIRGASGGAPNTTLYREPDILTHTSFGDSSTSTNAGINLIKKELGFTGTNAEILKKFAQSLVDEYLAVFNSIKYYNGFYIGRYELTGTATKPTVERNKVVLNASSSSANTWYGLKDACSKVVNGTDKFAQSHMIYGNQWDEVVDWLLDTGAKNNSELNNSTSWGNYNDSSGNAAIEGAGEQQKSGYSDAWSANNIYDFVRKLC